MYFGNYTPCFQNKCLTKLGKELVLEHVNGETDLGIISKSNINSVIIFILLLINHTERLDS